MDLGEFTPPWLAHLLPRSTSATPDPITFPVTPLKVLVEVALGADVTQPPTAWSWTDATSITYTRDAITISRGRADESATADTSQLSATVDNRGGHWSTRNPMSPWYGQLRKGTPIRVSAEGHVRFTGFLSEIPPRWDLSGEDRYAPIAARGLFYRLTQGLSPVRSALYRTLLASDPKAYWPMEDLLGATVGASALSGGSPLTRLAGTVDFGSFTDLIGAERTPDFTVGSLQGIVSGVSATAWHAEFIMLAKTSASGAATNRIYTNGALTNLWRFFPPNAAGVAFTLVIDDPAGAGPLIFMTGPTVSASFMDQWHHVGVTAEQVGSDMVSNFYIDGVLVDTDTTAGTLGSPVQVLVNHNYTLHSVDFGHMAIGDGATLTTAAEGVDGYDGELAHVRFLRLCDEDGIVATCLASDSQAVGPQGIKSILDLLRDLEAADAGYLYEGLDFGLVYQSHTQRENTPVAFALDYTADGHVFPPLEPTDDDQKARNDVEVKRENGSSSRLTEESSDVELSIPNIGRRDESVTLNLATDDQTGPMAGLRLHLGTWPGYRYPTVAMNFSVATDLIADFCGADLAFRTTIDHPPDDIGPDQVDLIVEGYTETLEQFAWPIQANCSPYGPWHIFRTAETTGDSDAFVGYLVPTSCVLAASLDTTQTAVDILTTPPWSTSSDDWTPPAPVVVDGEAMNVSGVGYTVQDTYTRSVTDDWGTTTSGHPYTLQGIAADFDVTGTAGTIQPTTTGSRRSARVDIGTTDFDLRVEVAMNATPATGTNSAGLLGRMTDIDNYYLARFQVSTTGTVTLFIDKRAAGVTTTVASALSTLTHVDAAFKTIRFRGDGTQLWAKVWDTASTEPPGWTVSTTDPDVVSGTAAGPYGINNTAVVTHVYSYDNFVTLNPMRLTVARSANGVVKTHASGATLAFTSPGVLGL